MTAVSGWTPEIGEFSAFTNTQGISDWSAVVWDARTPASFAPDPLWVNGWLVSWQSGTLISSGVVTDVYADASGQLELRISGDVREVALGNMTAEVRINGAVVGSVNNSQHFSVNDWTVSDSSEDEPSATPSFLPNVTVLWVDGVEFDFDGGYTEEESRRKMVCSYSGNQRSGQMSSPRFIGISEPSCRGRWPIGSLCE